MKRASSKTNGLCALTSWRAWAGYERLLEALLNDDDDELVTWVGGFFDAEGFDLNRTNQALRNGLS